MSVEFVEDHKTVTICIQIGYVIKKLEHIITSVILHTADINVIKYNSPSTNYILTSKTKEKHLYQVYFEMANLTQCFSAVQHCDVQLNRPYICETK